jgi:hypothetical protein
LLQRQKLYSPVCRKKKCLYWLGRPLMVLALLAGGPSLTEAYIRVLIFRHQPLRSGQRLSLI